MADESEADVCDALQRDLDGAILRLLGEAASRFRLFRGDPVKREAVCPAGGRDRRGADLQSSVPRGMFRRMEIAAQRHDADAPAPVRLVLGGGTGGRRSGVAQLVELLETAVVVVGDVMCPWLLYAAAGLVGWTIGTMTTCHVHRVSVVSFACWCVCFSVCART